MNPLKLLGPVLFVVLSLSASAQDCATALPSSDPGYEYRRLPDGASKYAKEVTKVFALGHGISLKSALKVIRNKVLMSAWDLGLEGGNFSHTDRYPLKSVFTQAMRDKKTVLDYHYEEIGDETVETKKIYFEVVFLFKPEIVDAYPVYATRGWNYDRNMHCISPDAAMKIASLKQLITRPDGQNDADFFSESNEISFRQPLGVSLAHLMGIHVRKAADRPKVEQALREAGVTARAIRRLFDWRNGGLGGDELKTSFPPLNIEPAAALAIFESNRIPKDKVMWQDFERVPGGRDLIVEVYEKFAEDEDRLQYFKSLASAGTELLVNALPSRPYRMHVRLLKVEGERIHFIDLEKARTSGERAAEGVFDIYDLSLVGDVTALREMRSERR